MKSKIICGNTIIEKIAEKLRLKSIANSFLFNFKNNNFYIENINF